MLATTPLTHAPSRHSAGQWLRRATRFALAVFVSLTFSLPATAAVISYVQSNSAVPQTAQTSVPVTFNGAQGAGNLNIVVVGWNDSTATATSVTDSTGNTYVLAVGPTVVTGFLSQSIYYAKNIFAAAAGTNTVTVKFSQGAQFADIRILEYSGADLVNPLDVTAAGSGNSTTSNSGAVTTTNATDLIFGANIVLTHVTGPGANFTQRILTADGDIAEDRNVTAVGSYSATAPLTSGRWIMQMAAFRTPASGIDAQPPTAPANLVATAASGSQINLNWTASTDNVGVTGYRVERCSGPACANFAQVATAATTTYVDTNVLPATSYSYRVRATDAASNLSLYSGVASATTATVTSTLPVFVAETHSATGGAGAAASSSTLTLNVTGPNTLLIAAWHAEFDGGLSDSWSVTNNGVPGTPITDTDGYTGGTGNRLFRTYYWLNPPPGTNTIVVSNPYTGGNELAVSVVLFNNVLQSSPMSAPTLDVSPLARTGESETVSTSTTDLVVHVIADALLARGTLGAGETSRSIANDGVHPIDGDASLWISSKPGAPGSTTVSSSGWASRVINGVAVALHGAVSNVPTNLVATAVSTSQINLSWVAPGNFSATNYLIERCQVSGCTNFAQVGTSAVTTFSDTGLTSATTYTYQVRATDTVGNLTPYSNSASATTALAVDTQPPTPPASLAATAASGSQINLSWAASTDNVGVTGYLVERCQGVGCSTFSQIATPLGLTYSDTGLASATSYSYRVRATDAAANLSAYSSVAGATTQAPDTQPPTPPANLAATAASVSQINLTWTASTDNVGVTGYRVERCQGAGCSTFVQVATPAGTSYSDTGLASTTSYSYRVRATDAAANLSTYSNLASATTQAPLSGLVAAYAFDEGSGTTVTDFSGQGNTGTIVNATWGAIGKFGKALTFNGTNARVNIPDAPSLHLTNAMTLEAWVNPTNVASAWRDVVYKGGNDNYILEGTTNHSSVPGGGATLGASDIVIFGASPLTVNIWTHLAVTYDGATLRFYVNGNQASSQAATGSIVTSNTPLQIGGDTTFGQFFAGAIDEVRVYNIALTPAQILADIGLAIGTPDTQPPTAPSNLAAAVAGASQINLAWTASTDNVGVTQYRVERCLGAGCSNFAQVATPATTNFNDTGLVAGSTYSYRVRASDGAGNLSPYSNTATATLPGAAQLGQWQAPVSMPMVAVHASLMPNGKLVLFDGQDSGQLSQVWDLTTNNFTPATAPINIFCSGHTLLADGRVLVLGGHNGAHIGANATNIFNPQTQTWTVATSMADPRWYPTATPLPDGRVLVQSGETNCDGCFVARPDIYNPVTNSWTQLTSAPLSFPYYPHSFVLPDGRVFVSSTAEAPIISRVLNLSTLNWSAVGSTALDGGSAVMYRPGKILKAGTSANPDAAVRPSFNNSYVVDMTQATPAWRQVASMAFARTYATMVMLPDGTVFIEGGGTSTTAIDPTNAVYAAEIWDPSAETWTTVASATKPRLYHSTALLLPDGRVWVSGGGRFSNGTAPTDQFSAEFYQPPYLFKGARPTIASVPATLQYSQTFSVQTPDAAQIASVALIRLGSVTHAFNMSQYYVPLTFTPVTGALNVQAPANSNLAPPGHYMLFIVNTNGVPSVAPIVSLPVSGGSSQPPSAPANLVATGGIGSASLSWSASSGPNGVAGYSVYRANAPGVVPSVSNRIAQPTTTTFLDSTFPASGNYYYVVTARDSTGLESGPSNEAVATVTADLAPPSNPTGLAASAVSNSQINLAWVASTDNVGVSKYLVERCQGSGCSSFAQVATPIGVVISDNGLAASTSYSYRVRATDAAGNLSGYSNTASATTSAAPPPPTIPTFVQQASAVPQSTAVSGVAATFASVQTAGNLAVVVIGWNDTTASVTSVTDTLGNVYTRALGPTLGTGLTQSIYYAQNIAAAAAGVNKVTVAFTPAARYPDLRILEYSGIDSVTPVDTTTAAVGSSLTSSSGTAVTTNATDLLFAANMVAHLTAGPGPGFTSRVITSPDGDIAEDQYVTAAGSYTATAALTNGAGPWVMQMVAFRAAGSPAAGTHMLESGPAVQ